jgi:hypothetical protein
MMSETFASVLFGIVSGCLLCVLIYSVGCIVHDSGRKSVQDECNVFGKTRSRGAVYECSFKKVTG